MASQSPSGNLGSKRELEGSKFFKHKIKSAGSGPPSPFQMSKPRLAQTDAIVGSLPPGDNTVGGIVGGLKDQSDYQGVKAGKS